VKLAAFLPEHPAVAWGDLAWMRLRPWQDTIAQFFDAETLQKELFSIRSLAIISGSDAEALYLAGWLASRLRWTAVPGGTFTDSNGQPVAFTHERSGPLRRVRSVEITTAASHYFAMVSADDEGVVTLRAEGEGARAERLVPLQAIDNASLLERAILEPATNEVFETALRMVGTLLQ
jgi:glucose-6-phosphate dehydrogenase assembly protein OpcA